MEEGELIHRAKNGDKEAFGQIYKLYIKRIYRYIYFFVYNQALAEDLAQNTFIKAWKSFPSFSEKIGTLQAYLYKIAKNNVIDYQRKKKEVSLEVMEDVFPSGEDLEEMVTKIQNAEMVNKELLGLDKEEKQIIVLRYFEELSYEEIAKVLERKEGAIRVQVHRILKKLKDKIESNEN